MAETAGQAWMNAGLEGKVAIVTGAAGGIEGEIVRGLLGGGRRSRDIRQPDSAEPRRA